MRRSRIADADHHANPVQRGYNVLENLQSLSEHGEIWIAKTGNIRVGPSKILDHTLANRIGDSNEHDGDGASLPLQRQYYIARPGENDIRVQLYQLFRVDHAPFGVSCPANVDLDILTVGPTRLL